MAGKKHTVEVVKTDMEIEEHLDLHETGWKAQRVGWVFIFALILFAAFGFLGDGLASKKTVSGVDTKLEYQRFFRHNARMELRIDMNSSDSQTIISFPNNYLKRFRIESVMPEPKENMVHGDNVHYIFNGKAHMNIIFYLIPQEVGNIDGNISINGNRFSLFHTIYP